MYLTFDSLGELHEMIAAMGYVKATAPADMLEPGALKQPSGETASEGPGDDGVLNEDREQFDGVDHAEAPESEQGNEPAPAGELAVGATTGSTESAADTAASEAPKRKRRTKAEMEAARAAAATDSTQSVAMNVEPDTAKPANPFEASTSNPSAATQAILDAPSGQAATLAGIQAMQSNPFETAPVGPSEITEAVAQSPATQENPADAATFIETRSLEILSTQTEPLTAVKHMHLCRDFIAKHGQAKYLEGFALAGLPATIGTYKPEQCAKHQAALEFLNLNA